MNTKKTHIEWTDTCQENICCHKNFWFWAVIRIAIVVGMIVWAFYLGTRCGYGEWGDRKHDMRGMYSQKMEKWMHMRGDREKDTHTEMTEHCQMMPQMAGCEAYLTGSMTHDMMDMSMRDMGKMLDGKTGAELNKAFLEGMIPHHQWAVEMARYLAGSDKPELVKLGADIITAQTKEIEQMQKWMKEWGYETEVSMSGMMMQ